MAVLKKIAPLFGPLLMAFICLRYIKLTELIAVYGRASLLFLAASLCCNALLTLAKIHRIHTLLGREGAGGGFWPLARSYSLANLLGQVSNVLVSDLANAGALMAGSRHKKSIAAVFVFNRACDLASVLGLLLLFYLLEGDRLHGLLGLHQGKAVLLLGGVALAAACLCLFRNRVRGPARELRELAGRSWGVALCYAGVIFLCYGLAALCDARALRLQIPGGFLLLSYFMGSLISVLPISVAGIGTRDLLFVFLLSLVGVAPEAAVALSSLGFLFVPTVMLCLAYLVALLGERYEDRRHG